MPAAKGAGDSCLARTNWIHVGFTESKARARPHHGECDVARAEAGWFGVVLERLRRFCIFPRSRFSIPKVPNIGTAAFAKHGETCGFC